MYFRHSAGSTLQHHAWDKPPPGVDEALLEEMHAKDLVSIDYREHERLSPRDCRASMEPSALEVAWLLAERNTLDQQEGGGYDPSRDTLQAQHGHQD